MPEIVLNPASNICSMKSLEGLIVVLAMLVPFIAIKSHDLSTYAYWSVVTAIYLVYISLSRW